VFNDNYSSHWRQLKFPSWDEGEEGLTPWVVERRKVSRRRTFRSVTTQGVAGGGFQPLGTRLLAWVARRLGLSNSRMWA